MFISCTVNSSRLALMVRQEAHSNTSGSLGKFLQKRNWERDRLWDKTTERAILSKALLRFFALAMDGVIVNRWLMNEVRQCCPCLSWTATLLFPSSSVIPTGIETLDMFKMVLYNCKYWMEEKKKRKKKVLFNIMHYAKCSNSISMLYCCHVAHRSCLIQWVASSCHLRNINVAFVIQFCEKSLHFWQFEQVRKPDETKTQTQYFLQSASVAHYTYWHM